MIRVMATPAVRDGFFLFLLVVLFSLILFALPLFFFVRHTSLLIIPWRYTRWSHYADGTRMPVAPNNFRNLKVVSESTNSLVLETHPLPLLFFTVCQPKTSPFDKMSKQCLTLKSNRFWIGR